MNQAWGGPIIYPNIDNDNLSELEDDNIFSKELYISKLCEFQKNIDTRVL